MSYKIYLEIGLECLCRCIINLNQLKGSYHTAKCLSLKAAIRKFFITQPAVTAQMKSF